MYGQPIKIGYNGGFCTAAPSMAGLLGFYEEEGLEIEVISGSRLEDAIGTNQVQITTGHIASFLVPTINGINMVFTTGAHTGCKSLYVLADNGYNSTEDLIGHTIGVPNGIGDSDHNIGLRFLNRDNIDVEDVDFRPVEQSAVILAMQNDEVQAAVLSDQFAEKFVEDGTIKVIRSLTYDEMTEETLINVLNDYKKFGIITSEKSTEELLDEVNTMTIAWGSISYIWNRPIFMVAVRYSRHTYNLIENAKEFTVSIPLNNDLRKELKYCGTKSGRDVNKFEACKLTPIKGQKISTPIIGECELHYECKVVYQQAMEPNTLARDIKSRNYLDNDYHVLYFGEIVDTYLLNN